MNRAGKFLAQRFPGESFSAAELADFLSVVGCCSVAPGRVEYQAAAAHWRRLAATSARRQLRGVCCDRHTRALSSSTVLGAVELPQ